MQALASGDRDGFLAAEMAARRDGRHAALRPAGGAHRLGRRRRRGRGRGRAPGAQPRPNADGVRVLGPAPAPLALLRGRHRQRLLLHAARNVAVSPLVRALARGDEAARPVRVQVDIDPYSFL